MEGAASNVARLLATDPKRIFVIAEAGLNHGGSKERALALVRAAKWAGADAVKFQSFRIERVADSHPFRTFAGQGLKMQIEFKNPDLSHDALCAVYREAHRLEIEIFAAPHDEDSTDLSDKLGARAFKIESGGIARRPWIKHVGRKAKPVLLSTEMSSTEEVRTAVEWMSAESNDQTILMHGVSAYPATGEELNLKVIHQLRKKFGFPIGFMDNTVGGLAAITAVSLGAQLIERHLSVDNLSSAEAQAVSMDPKHFKTHIDELRRIGVILKARESHAVKPRVRLAVAANR